MKTISEAKVNSMIHVGEFYPYSTSDKHLLRFLVLLLFCWRTFASFGFGWESLILDFCVVVRTIDLLNIIVILFFTYSESDPCIFWARLE